MKKFPLLFLFIASLAQAAPVDTGPLFNLGDSSGLQVNPASRENQTNGTQKAQVVDGSGNVAPAGDVAARKGFTAITDGTNTAAVKAASVPAATTDPALVVSISPNTPITIAAVPSYGTIASYSASVIGFVPPASAATDIFTIYGSATKTVSVTKISCSISTTSGSGILFNSAIIKRSSANTGGTSAVATNVSYDSNSGAGTATVRSYTANATGLGTAIGTVRAYRRVTTNSSIAPVNLESAFADNQAQPLVLRGTSEGAAFNLGGASITGPIASCYVEWTEQ